MSGAWVGIRPMLAWSKMPLHIHALVQITHDDDGFVVLPEINHVSAGAALQVSIPNIDGPAIQCAGCDPLDSVEEIGDVSVSLRR